METKFYFYFKTQEGSTAASPRIREILSVAFYAAYVIHNYKTGSEYTLRVNTKLNHEQTLSLDSRFRAIPEYDGWESAA
jgi:hypothetical protein